MEDNNNDSEQELWQGCGEIIIFDESVAQLFHWPLNPPTMTVIDEYGNEVDLT